MVFRESLPDLLVTGGHLPSSMDILYRAFALMYKGAAQRQSTLFLD